ncbi:hypothetical protein C0J52_21273 [Blattella germanica]|nr:hypothetical protein C0J52_21273 [Blattella germanica]
MDTALQYYLSQATITSTHTVTKSAANGVRCLSESVGLSSRLQRRSSPFKSAWRSYSTTRRIMTNSSVGSLNHFCGWCAAIWILER